MKPAVDRLEERLGQKLTFVKLEVQSEVGKLLYVEYEANLVPTFIMFDQYGATQYRTNGVPEYSLINSKLLLNSIPHSLLNKVDKAMYISERRWDIILKNGLYLKLAENKISDSLENYIKIIKNISNDELKKIESIDLRIPNKAIIKFIK